MAKQAAATGDDWRSRSYPIKEDMAFQRRSWLAERIGWIALYCFLGASILGLFSQGVLSNAQARSGPITVTYDRFLRFEADYGMRIELAAAAAREILIGPEFAEVAAITAIVPPPDTATSGPKGLLLQYPKSKKDALTVDIGFRAMELGPMRVSVASGGAETSFLQFVYP